ncbi:MAG: sodium:solute symporter family protein [Steroidobacteraceae bacterium]|nr:sodium:solute symporter family protein [Steroidobacteraceae bacterium]
MTLAITLAIVLGTMLGALYYGHRQARAHTMGEWAVGGRRFGSWIFWFVNAGEIYTTFAVLGIAGYAWAYGAPAYLAFTSVSLASALGYWLMPKIWAAGKRHDLVTQADFFERHYGSTWLAVVVALAGIAALVVYVQIQITALAMIVRLTVGPAISPLESALVAALVMLAFVYVAGLRSAAFAAGIKDVLMIVLVVALSLTVASKVGASSMLDVYRLVQVEHPGIGDFPGLKPEAGLTSTWLVTAALNVALGTWIFPHMFQLIYSAGSITAIRRNAVWQPLYSLSYFFIILLGFGALLAGTQPPGGDPNAVLLQFVTDEYPAWAVGLLAGTGCLLALVPGSILLLGAASIFGRNVVLPLKRDLPDRTVLWTSRAAMLAFAAAAVWLSVTSNESLVEIGLSAYAAIGMLAPGVFLAFLWPRASAVGVFAGIVAGYCALLLPPAEALWARLLPEWDTGLVAMGVNLAVAVVVSLLVPRTAALRSAAESRLGAARS